MKPLQNNNKIKIFQEAEELFYQNGYTNTSIDEIIKCSQTSKGTFYHYYKSKAELGLYVYRSTYLQHGNVILDLFPNEEYLIRYSLEARIFWYAYYEVNNYRRFYYEISREPLNFQAPAIIKTCLEHTPKKFTKNEIDLIIIAAHGMRQHISHHIFDKLDQFPYQTIYKFTVSHFFKLFEIPDDVIENIMTKSDALFNQLNIQIDKFNHYVTLK
ncbi:TetR/AcrR family transcriptional regulator [Acetobacterium woodii]|uniref:Transcriptional regulator n=1 Tax=Acetobacterium woodii (strain ATCC 29683 / DSM 1030 / JCM 2381 / KCTC 1655 / WB1) TaxID=931626 RepID=H6LDV4_ACEWD|nr:TetR/AcrR family transcriptional regulator [Acetobacterium woodii]AFA47997.1 transcriptional regulator [Acetobacterium woodii DSM 1030]